MRKAKRRRVPAKKRPALPVPANDLNAASRAQLGAEEGKRIDRPRADDASVQDPLDDWPVDA